MTKPFLLCLCITLLACQRTQPPRAGDVVFICEHGAAKSVVAREYFNKLAADRGLAIRAIARGAEPQAELSLAALAGLHRDGLSPPLDAPRAATAAELHASSRIVAFDCPQPAMKALPSRDACWDDVPAMAADYPRARNPDSRSRRRARRPARVVAEVVAPLPRRVRGQR